MKIISGPVCALAISLVLSGCGQKKEENAKSSASAASQTQDVSQRLDALESRLASISTDVDGLQASNHSTVILDPLDKGFERLDTDIGHFLVALKDVEPYADGIKVTLDIGNIQSVSYENFTITAKYGLRYPSFPANDPNRSKDETARLTSEWIASYDAHTKSLKNTTAEFPEKLLPGRWNHVILTLPNIKTTEFGYLEISLSAKTVMMLQ